jgi:hypothetical protein
METVCIVASLSNMFSTMPPIGLNVSRNFRVPAIFTMGEKQDIMEGGIGRMQMAYSSQTSTSKP